MKRTIISFILMLIVAATMQAQQPTGDTIYGRNPRYFYGWWPDEWFPLDTTIMYPDTTYVVRSYDPVTGVVVIDTIADSVSKEIYHSAYHNTRDGLGQGNPARQEFIQRRHTDSSICIIGLAAAVHLSDHHDPYKIDCNISDTTDYDEHLLLYKELPDTLVCLRRVRWNMGMVTPTCVLEIPCSGSLYCCERERHTDWSLMKEFYFDIPVVVSGDFYVGGSYQVIQYCGSYYESLVTGCYTDTCPSMYFPGKCRSIDYPYYNCDIWHDYPRSKSLHYILIFPIIGSMCPEVTDLGVTQSTSDSLLIEWGTDWHQASWELQYYPLGTDPDSAETIVCNHPIYLLTGLDSTLTYNVRVRAVCTYDSTYRSEWKRIAVHNGITIGINTVNNSPDDGILLRPNPADRQVTVSAPLPLKHVEVYDLAGRMVEAHQPSGTALQIDLKAYPTGTYLVKVTTSNGTVTKKLVVR